VSVMGAGRRSAMWQRRAFRQASSASRRLRRRVLSFHASRTRAQRTLALTVRPDYCAAVSTESIAVREVDLVRVVADVVALTEAARGAASCSGTGAGARS